MLFIKGQLKDDLLDGPVTMVTVGICVPCRSEGAGLNEKQCVMSRETDRTNGWVWPLLIHDCIPLYRDTAVQPCGSVSGVRLWR